jgi:GTP:adenosylcobinamide-phosphate guanylyltransferase
MDALVTAGGIPKPEDPLYSLTQGKPKALLDIAGKPLAQWVLDALGSARNIDRIVLIGLEDPAGLTAKKPITFLPTQGGLLENVLVGSNKVLEQNSEAKYIISVSSDIPAITADMVEWVVDTAEASNYDLYYNVISRQTMEQRFPDSNRSYLHLKDQDLCGGDMNVFSTSLINRSDDLVQRVIDARKSPIKQAALIGLDSLILLLLRRLTLQDAVARVSKRFKIQGKAVICPYAEVGMDVDKPFQYEILDADLRSRAAA